MYKNRHSRLGNDYQFSLILCHFDNIGLSIYEKEKYLVYFINSTK